jgi:hypothetical protein
MARKTRLTPYGEQIVEAFELDESGYRFTPSMATKDGFASDVPLFLSDHDEEREPPDTGKVWYRAAISSRNLKTSILVVTAAAIVFAILAVEIQSRSLRMPRPRWSAYRRHSLAPVSRRRQFNQAPALRPRRLQETRRRTPKLLPLLILPIRVRPKSVSHQPKPH